MIWSPSVRRRRSSPSRCPRTSDKSARRQSVRLLPPARPQALSASCRNVCRPLGYPWISIESNHWRQAMGRRILNRKEMRADYDAAEKRKEDEEKEEKDEAEDEDEDE